MLGLSGQPRAVIFHIKADERGRMREHCHVVWSRIDVDQGKAVPLSFFKEKMMTVTREFARDHRLVLPPGYDRQADELRRNRQLSGYDCIKQKETGISHEDRMAAVTDAWRRSDSGRAFVNALADLGYIFARGRNKTRVVLVDVYGHTTALTRLIDDPSVRARHVRDFLGAEYAPENLPSVEDAQALAAQRRKLVEAFESDRCDGEQPDGPVRQQTTRREEAEAQAALLRRQQHDERVQLAAVHKSERQALKESYMAAQRRIRLARARRRPRGLAAFLGRVSGVALIIRKIQRHRDRRRYRAFLLVRHAIRQRQQQEYDALTARHELQSADVQRRLRALDKVEQRERDSLAQAARRERRHRINKRHTHMPAFAIAPGQAARADMPSGRYEDSALACELAAAAALLKHGKPHMSLSGAFARVSGSEDGDDDSGESGSRDLAAQWKRPRRPHPRKRLCREFDRSASGDQDEGEAGGSRSEGPKPSPGPKPPRRRRKKRPPREEKLSAKRSSAAPDERKTDEDQARQKKRKRRPRRDFDPGM
jgi:hypothetical protein